LAIPTFDLTASDVAGCLDALQECQGLLHDGFPRSESRAHVFDSLVGPLRPRARKSREPIALQVPGGSVRRLQRCLSAVVWEEEPLRWTYHQVVAAEMGAPEGVRMCAETGWVPTGRDAVGVARHYCGALGTVEHCPVGVCAG
jgi:SRSO17 transposase